MTFLTASTDRNDKLSEGLCQVYAKNVKEIAVGIDINTRFRCKREQSDDKAQRKRRNVVLGGVLPFIKLHLTGRWLKAETRRRLVLWAQSRRLSIGASAFSHANILSFLLQPVRSQTTSDSRQNRWGVKHTHSMCEVLCGRLLRAAAGSLHRRLHSSEVTKGDADGKMLLYVGLELGNLPGARQPQILATNSFQKHEICFKIPLQIRASVEVRRPFRCALGDFWLHALSTVLGIVAGQILSLRLL